MYIIIVTAFPCFHAFALYIDSKVDFNPISSTSISFNHIRLKECGPCANSILTFIKNDFCSILHSFLLIFHNTSESYFSLISQSSSCATFLFLFCFVHLQVKY